MFALSTRKEDRHLKALGHAIRSCRQAMGMSEQEFADQLKTSVKFVQRLELGFEEPRVFALIACADIFGLSVTELLELAHMERDSQLVCLEFE